MKLRPAYNEQIKRMVEYFDYKYSYAFSSEYVTLDYIPNYVDSTFMMGAFTQLEDKSEGWWQRHNWINNWTSHTRVVVWDSDDELIMFNTNDQSYAIFTNLDRISPEAASALILQEF